MSEMSTADFVKAAGNQLVVNIPPPLVSQWPYSDAAETVKVRLRVLLAGDALYSIGSTFTSSAVVPKPAEAAMTKVYPQHKATTIVDNNGAVTVVATLAIGGGTVSAISTASMTDEWSSGVTSIAFLADASAGDDMLPDISEAISNLRESFELRDEETVVSFLRGNRYLLPLLGAALSHISKHFEDSPPLILQVVPDSEEPDFGRLYVFIRTEQPVDEAIRRLRNLGMAWWLHVPPGIRRKMSIDIEPV